MKRGTGGGVIRLKTGELLGITLGADFTAEHECGIKRLVQIYGIDDADEGISRRQIKRAPFDRILFGSVEIETRDYSKPRSKPNRVTWWGIASHTYPNREESKFDSDMVHRCGLTPYGDVETTGAWDDASFGFLVKEKAVADEIFDAIQRIDLCIGLFNGQAWNPFSRSGLGLLIASRVPQSVRYLWLESDRDKRRLTEAAAATGIAKRLDEAGIRYYALSPNWSDDKKTDVKFWLNPMEQDKNNFGWFTVSDLDAWIKGKGPIPKNAEEVP